MIDSILGKGSRVVLLSFVFTMVGMQQVPASDYKPVKKTEATSSLYRSRLDGSFTVAKTETGFPYMEGGVGIDERQLMAERDDNFNVKLIFAEKSGIYMADVKLVFTNQKGEEVVNTTAEGPWFYIQLPTGQYDVKASFAGRTKVIRNIPVSKSRQTSRIFHWDLPLEPEHPQLVTK